MASRRSLFVVSRHAGRESAMATHEKKQELRNPRDKYPKPPYKKQSQSWPGLAGKMDPPPDHGEQSYRGSGRLQGRKPPLTGGDPGKRGAGGIDVGKAVVSGGAAHAGIAAGDQGLSS